MTALIRLALTPSSGLHRHSRNQWNFYVTISSELFPDFVVNSVHSATSSFYYAQLLYCIAISSNAFTLIN